MKTTAPITGRAARLATGLTLQEVGERLHRSPAYLGQCERQQSFPLVLAERLARLYQCDLNVFRPGVGQSSSTRRGNAPRRKQHEAGVRRSAPASGREAR